ncbi:hypothetical protein BDV40DRAFT_264586, partial [Aspergillus tamarii]
MWGLSAFSLLFFLFCYLLFLEEGTDNISRYYISTKSINLLKLSKSCGLGNYEYES